MMNTAKLNELLFWV